MQAILTKVLGRLLALIGGLVWGFFVAFNAVFTDVFGVEVYAAIAYVLIAYIVLGMAFGILGSNRATRWTGWLSAPGMLMVAFTMFMDPDHFTYTGTVLSAVVVGSLLGSASGAALARLWFSRSERRGGAS